MQVHDLSVASDFGTPRKIRGPDMQRETLLQFVERPERSLRLDAAAPARATVPAPLATQV